MDQGGEEDPPRGCAQATAVGRRGAGEGDAASQSMDRQAEGRGAPVERRGLEGHLRAVVVVVVVGMDFVRFGGGFVAVVREVTFEEEQGEQAGRAPAKRGGGAQLDGLGQHVEEGGAEHGPRGEAQINLEPGMGQHGGQRQESAQEARRNDRPTEDDEREQHVPLRGPEGAGTPRPLATSVATEDNGKRLQFAFGSPLHHAIPMTARCAMAKLSEAEIQTRLPEVKGWERHGDMLVRSWRFASARRALEFVGQVVGLAEKTNHFPDVVLSYRDVRVELSTHDSGGLTPEDFALASSINALPTDR